MLVSRKLLVVFYHHHDQVIPDNWRKQGDKVRFCHCFVIVRKVSVL